MSEQTITTKDPEFQGIRAFFWPIHAYELKKFLPMGFMLFLMTFIYVILRDTKDTLIITAPNSGAEAIAYLKLYVMTPVTVLFVLGYIALSKVLSRQGLFYAIFIPFLLFFWAFSSFIYPNRETLHLSSEAISALQMQYPNFAYAMPALGNWSYSLFYILAALWPAAIITMLFWQFANEIMTVKDAKRFYILLVVFANLGLMLGGYVIINEQQSNQQIVDLLSTNGIQLDPGTAWETTLESLMAWISLAGFFILVLYAVMNRTILKDERFYKPTKTESGQVIDKPQLPFVKSLVEIFKSPYLWLMIGIIFAYATSTYITNTLWKGQIAIAFPSPGEYNNFMAESSMSGGIISGILLIFAAYIILHRCSWFTAAVITPVLLLISSLAFFGFVAYANGQDPTMPFMGSTISKAVAWMGAWQKTLIKSLGLYWVTLQIAYIPLNQDLKVKGKAVVDVFFKRLSLPAGAVIMSNLQMSSGGAAFSTMTPLLALIMIVIVGFWIWCLRSLSHRFEALNKESEA
jgi:AAA family ATP:ADP antiporter